MGVAEQRSGRRTAVLALAALAFALLILLPAAASAFIEKKTR